MKIGITSYCFAPALSEKRLTPLEAITWAAKNGAESFEISPGEYFPTTDDLPEQYLARAREEGIPISSYTVGANFVKETAEERAAEVLRVKGQVDIAVRLGVKFMRFDAGWRSPEEATLENFEKDLPLVAACAAEVADYANQFGIVTSVENHGYHFQGAERVQRLLRAVNRPYYRTTLDVGNFSCADENNVLSVKENIKYASMVHLKDFFMRPATNPPLGEGWFRSKGGTYLRGSIVGQGSLDMRSICKIIRDSGYDGYVSVEIDGNLEDVFKRASISIANAKELLRG